MAQKKVTRVPDTKLSHRLGEIRHQLECLIEDRMADVIAEDLVQELETAHSAMAGVAGDLREAGL